MKFKLSMQTWFSNGIVAEPGTQCELVSINAHTAVVFVQGHGIVPCSPDLVRKYIRKEV